MLFGVAALLGRFLPRLGPPRKGGLFLSVDPRGPPPLRGCAQACRVHHRLWPDDWAASPRTAGRPFRLPLQMIDAQPAPVLGRGSHAPCCERTYDGDWDCEVVQRTKGLWLHPAR